MELAERQSDSTEWQNLALVNPFTGFHNRRFAERYLKSERGYTHRLIETCGSQWGESVRSTLVFVG